MAPRRRSKENAYPQSSKIQTRGCKAALARADQIRPISTDLSSDHVAQKSLPPERKSKKKGPFPFLSLPPEIRNEIYSYLLPKDTSVSVRIVAHDEYSELLKHQAIERTSFALHKRFEGEACNVRDSYRVETITYATKSDELINSLGLLGVSRQVRRETLGRFYSTNTFHFEDWKTMKPFFVDRSPEVMQLIESMSISIIPARGENIYNIHNGYEGPMRCRIEWASALQNVGRLPKLRLKRLFLNMQVEGWDFYVRGSQIYVGNPQVTGWLRKSFGRAISNLDELGVRFHWNESPRSGFLAIPPPPREVIEHAEEELWNSLAPRLLKKVDGRLHEGPALLDRRIFPDP